MRTLLSTACDLFEPPRPLTVVQWAEEHRVIGKGVSARPGRYSADFAPYQREPQEAFTDPAVQVTVLDWASRLGKTEMLNNLDGYIIDHEPANVLVVYPTLDSAKKWRKEFFDPMLEATPRLRRRIAPARSRDSSNTTLHVRFAGGVMSCIGTNSPSAFRQIQAPVVRCDEIDAMVEGREGDPIILAFKRADNYARSIQVLSSTPTIKGFSRIESWLEKSDYRKWHVPCPKCGKEQVIMWEQVDWPKNEPHKAVLLCAHCAAALDDRARVQMIRAGVWRATQEFTGIRGYWLNGLNTVFPAKKGYRSKLHQFAAEFLDAKHSADGKAAVRVWVNTFKAETYEDESEKLSADPLVARREHYLRSPLPAGVLVITAGVDVQTDRLEAELVGWGLGEETWGLGRAVFIGDPIRKQVWDDLDAWLLQTFPHPGGAQLHVAATCIDTGGHRTASTYDFIRPRQMRRIFAVKGFGIPAMPIVSRPKKTRVKKVKLIMVGADTAKELIYGRLALQEFGPGFCHYSLEPELRYDEEYFRQLTIERAFTIFRHGQAVKTFKKPNAESRNEALDMRVYALAAFKLLNANLAHIAKNLTVPAENLSADVMTPPDQAAVGDSPTGADARSAKPRAKPAKSKPPRRGFVMNFR